MEATRGNGYAPVRGTPAMMMMMTSDRERSTHAGEACTSDRQPVNANPDLDSYCQCQGTLTIISDCSLSNCFAVQCVQSGGCKRVFLLLIVTSLVVQQNADNDDDCAEPAEECDAVTVDKNRQPDSRRTLHCVAYTVNKHIVCHHLVSVAQWVTSLFDFR